jgi:hypothetical protein
VYFASVECKVFGDSTLSCIHPLWPGANTSRLSLTGRVPADVNFIVPSGQVPPSKLAQVYFTSAAPSVVMVPLNCTFVGQTPAYRAGAA